MLGWQFLFFVLLVNSSPLFAMHNPQFVSENIPVPPKPTLDKKAEAQFNALTSATGYFRIFESDPIGEVTAGENNKTLQFVAAPQAGCSAVYIEKNPPIFLTAAHCFTDIHKRTGWFPFYGKLFGKHIGYYIDPPAIIIHPEYVKNPKANDLAVFTLEQGRDSENFSQWYSPVNIIPADSWNPEGQLSLIVSWGSSTSRKPNEFGKAQFKKFLRADATLEETQKDPGLLPEDGLITLKTADGSKGITCNGDSGAGVFVELDDPNSKSGTNLYLQSLVLGKAGKACEETDRYVVATDLRPHVSWILSAKAELEKLRQKAALGKTEREEARKKLYLPTFYKDPFPLWYDLDSKTYSAQLSAINKLSENQQHRELYGFMLKEQKRRFARANLRDGLAEGYQKDKSVDPKPTPYDLPDPFAIPTGMVEFKASDKRRDFGKGGVEVFINPSGNYWIDKLYIRNIGAEPITFNRVIVVRVTTEAFDKTEIEPIKLLPGKGRSYTINGGSTAFLAQLAGIHGIEGNGKFQVYGHLPTELTLQSGRRYQKDLNY